jgi:hypothetical protein
VLSLERKIGFDEFCFARSAQNKFARSGGSPRTKLWPARFHLSSNYCCVINGDGQNGGGFDGARRVAGVFISRDPCSVSC